MDKADFFNPAKLEAYYGENKGDLSSIRDVDFSSSELVELATLYRHARIGGDLYQVLAAHSNADDDVFQSLLTLSSDWHSVVNAIATSGRASTHLLEELQERNVDSFAAMHIRLALFANQLSRTTQSQFDTLFEQIQTDDEFSMAAREQLAYYSATPVYILKKLTHDDYDHIAAIASRRLQLSE